MASHDEFTEAYSELLDGSYDCVDRLVLNAYFRDIQTPGGFRNWWRKLFGGDENLNTNNLIKFAGRFSRRVHAWAKDKGIPIITSHKGERKHDIAEEHRPSDPEFRGVFCVIIGRAQAPIYEARRFGKTGLDIRKKTPLPFVNQYSFHIMDPEEGHVTIKFCPHPPFPVQIILNGHEYVAIQARRENIRFTKEENCFTEIPNAAGLARVADTMSASSAVGRLVSVCERWIYSAVLVFALDLAEQTRSGFKYSFSVYQAEYSRNLLFHCGGKMQEIFQAIIDRTRSPMDIRSIKTIFGHKHRPWRRRKPGERPSVELVIQKSDYDLVVFKIHYGKLTVKIYTKSKAVLRIEATADNARELRTGTSIERYPQIVAALKSILERFTSALYGIDASFLNDGTLDKWPRPSTLGKTRIGGIDVNKLRARAGMQSAICLAASPRGFTSAEFAERMSSILHPAKKPKKPYDSRKACYDLAKMRAKRLVEKVQGTRRYQPTLRGLRAMAAFLTLRDKVLIPILSGACRPKPGPRPKNQTPVDIYYANIRKEMVSLLPLLGVAV